jgi:uncharacterized protein YecT (DUF1311 family)
MLSAQSLCRVRYGERPAEEAMKARFSNARWAGVLTALALLMCNVGRAADCTDPRSSQEVAQCLEQTLRAADARINETYAEIMAKLDVPGQQQLRDEQRAWVRRRDMDCGLDSRKLTREQWYQELLTQYASAVCVARYTQNRSSYLDGLLRKDSTSGEIPAKTPANATPPEQSAAYESISRTGRQTGLWYFEMTISRFVLKTENPFDVVAIWAGCRRPHWHGGATTRIIPAMTYAAVHIGIALDLNAGKMYMLGPQGWVNNGEPGSSAGLDVKLGQLYRCGLESAIPLRPLLDDHTLDINYGEHGFYYQIPDGYRPFADGGV